MDGFQTAFRQLRKGKPMKPMTVLMTAAVFSVLSLNACGGSEKSRIQEQTEARFQLNPHPKQAYRLRIKINDAPGPLKLMRNMSVGYGARDCSYIINHIEGASANPEKKVRAETRKLAEFEYEAIIYADAVQDEDYFGEGVCHWKVEGFGLGFQATGSPNETIFNFGDSLDDLIEKKTLTKYYWKGGYPYFKNIDGSNSNTENTVSFGGDTLTDFSEDRWQDLFTIAVTLEEIKP